MRQALNRLGGAVQAICPTTAQRQPYNRAASCKAKLSSTSFSAELLKKQVRVSAAVFMCASSGAKNPIFTRLAYREFWSGSSTRQGHQRDVFGGCQFVELLAVLASEKSFDGFARGGLKKVCARMADLDPSGFA